jgi:hypothetical protein
VTLPERGSEPASPLPWDDSDRVSSPGETYEALSRLADGYTRDVNEAVVRRSLVALYAYAEQIQRERDAARAEVERLRETLRLVRGGS